MIVIMCAGFGPTVSQAKTGMPDAAAIFIIRLDVHCQVYKQAHDSV